MITVRRHRRRHPARRGRRRRPRRRRLRRRLRPGRPARPRRSAARPAPGELAHPEPARRSRRVPAYGFVVDSVNVSVFAVAAGAQWVGGRDALLERDRHGVVGHRAGPRRLVELDLQRLGRRTRRWSRWPRLGDAQRRVARGRDDVAGRRRRVLLVDARRERAERRRRAERQVSVAGTVPPIGGAGVSTVYGELRRGGGRDVPRAAELLLERVAEAEHLRVVERAADELDRDRVAVRVRADRQHQRRQPDVRRQHAAVAVARQRLGAVVVVDVRAEARVDDRVDVVGVHPGLDARLVLVAVDHDRLVVVGGHARADAATVWRLYGSTFGEERISDAVCTAGSRAGRSTAASPPRRGCR